MPNVDFTDFSAGWTPDIAESEIALNAANRLENAYTRNLSMTADNQKGAAIPVYASVHEKGLHCPRLIEFARPSLCLSVPE